MTDRQTITVGDGIRVPLATHLHRQARVFPSDATGRAWIEGRSFTYRELDRHFSRSESATVRRVYVEGADCFAAYDWDRVGKIGPADVIVPTPNGDYAVCFNGQPDKALILYGIVATFGIDDAIDFGRAAHFARVIVRVLDEAIPSPDRTGGDDAAD